MPTFTAQAHLSRTPGHRLTNLRLVAAIHLALCCAPASAQMIPQREFCGIGRPIPITVHRIVGRVEEPGVTPPLLAPPPATTVPDPEKFEVEILRAATGEVIDRAATGPGETDLVRLFPKLWEAPDRRAMLAQLRIDGRRTGPPLILIPMFSPPPYAPRVDRAGFPMFPPPPASATDRAPASFSGYRVETMRLLVLETSKGELKFALRPDLAPTTVWFFSRLVEGGLYTEVEFHKVASLTAGSSPDFVQGGDPTGTGLGGAGFLIDLEDSPLRHDFGVISLARASDPNSASSQFFISLGGAGAATLDGKYAAFGQIVSGADALRAIAATPVGPDNRPLQPPKILSARLVDAPPLGDGPPPQRDPLADRPAR